MPQLSVLIGTKQYVFAREFSPALIVKRAAKQRAETSLGVFFLWMAGMLILASIGVAYFNQSITIPLVTLPFFVGLFFVMLIIYHLAETQTIKQTIPVRAIGEILPLTQPLISDVEQMDISKLFDTQAQTILDEAFSLAQKFGHAQVEPLHLFVTAMTNEHAGAVLGRLQIEFEKIKEPLGRRLGSRQRGTKSMITQEAEDVLLRAFVNAYANGRHVVNTFEIFDEAFAHDPFIQELFFDQGITVAQFANMVEWIRIHEKSVEQYAFFRKAAMHKPTGAMNRSMTSIATPLLDAFSQDLTTAAVQGNLSLLVGRERELVELFRVMEGGKESVILVGPQGVGKSAIIEGVAILMVEERVPQMLQDKRLVRLSLAHLFGGAELAEAEERLRDVLSEAIRSGNIVLAMTDLEQLAFEAQGLFVEMVSQSGLFVIATATPQGYVESIERSALTRIFQKISVSEPEETEAIHVLESKILAIEYEHSVTFTYLSIEKIVQLCDRFMHESYLPQKAIEIAQEVALMVKKEKGKEGIVTEEDVARVVSEKTGVPTTRVAQKETELLLHLEDRIHDRVVGQDEAVKAVASALRRARTQLAANNRPMATFLFLGPTGVGKTELAKTVSQTYFGDEANMIRLDMSEYQQQDSIARLIGRPGSNEGGLLTESVRQQPFALLLLDEFEKAHPDLLNLFLQVFDDGRLTDAMGRTIDFTNTIIIATSNAGSAYIQTAMKEGVSSAQIKTHLLEEELRGVYRPELLNRFDGVIVFTPLLESEIVDITKRLVARVSQRLEAKGMYVRASDEVIADLAHRGYDPLFGARPLRRLVQEEVDNAIANALLEGKVKRRDTIVIEKGGIRIETAPPL